MKKVDPTKYKISHVRSTDKDEKNLFEKINNSCQNFKSLSNLNKCIFLVTSEDKQIKLVAKYITDNLEERDWLKIVFMLLLKWSNFILLNYIIIFNNLNYVMSYLLTVLINLI